MNFENIKTQKQLESWIKNDMTSTFWIGRLSVAFGRVILNREDENKIPLIEALLAQFGWEDRHSSRNCHRVAKWTGYTGIRFSLDNIKLTGGYLITNLSPALICKSSHCGYCDSADICYGKADEQRHKNSAYNNLHNMLVVLKSSPEEEALRLVKFLKPKELKYIIWHRVNVNGEFWNAKALNWAIRFSLALKQLLPNLVNSYSYSHNKELKQAETGDLVLNWSFANKYGTKQCQVRRKWSTSLTDSSKYVICDGNCDKCSYCKDKEEHRIIIFFAHGALKVWKDEVPEWFKSEVAQRKHSDWVNFCNKMGIDPETS